ncbi:MAG: hypothetical protein EXS58_07465 [Candidatus Latescibacteria bacterium]|nr:hypothetical protein [Candidatus Latescibacterota bacterium]
MSDMNEPGDLADEEYEEGEDAGEGNGDGEEGQAGEGANEQSGAQGGHPKTWYPYITKTQFEKFISRLQAKVPEQVDRDYVRAIIRTPSMIYRFLRGIEAMRLIDRDHRPTERLRSLIVPETRRQAVGDVIKDLYPELHKQWEEKRELPDHEVTAFFRRKTGMGNDSATKMRMFFKFLMAESDMESGGVTAEAARPAAVRAAPAAPVVAAPPPRHTPEPEPQRRGGERPAPVERTERGSAPDRDRGGERPAPVERTERGTAPDRDRDRDRSNASDRDRGGANDRDRGGASDRDRAPAADTQPYSNRPLSEPQRAYLETLQGVLNINIDGDWDEDMIRLVFDRLERLYDRVRRG